LRKARRRNRLDRETCQQLAYDHLTSHPCIDCGETDITVLDFDHRERSGKTDDIAALIRRGNPKLLVSEMAKCDVRCANDHRRKTAREFGYARWVARDE